MSYQVRFFGRLGYRIVSSSLRVNNEDIYKTEEKAQQFADVLNKEKK